MTISEVLRATVEVLGDINIKVSETERIGRPIAGAVNNLMLCIDALENPKKEEKPEEKQEEPEQGEVKEDAGE